MAIRTKNITVCSSVPTGSNGNGQVYYDWVCNSTTEPITDWNINPQNPNFAWSQGNAVPANFSQVITVAELNSIYPDYDSFRFTIEFTNSFPGVSWLAKTCAAITGTIAEGSELNLNLQPAESTTVYYSFQNLGSLPSGSHVIYVKLRAYGIKNGVETYLSQEESMPFASGTITLNVTNGTSTPNSINTDKSTLNLIFNKAGEILSGDTSVLAYSSGVTATLNFTSLSAVASPSGSNTQILIQKNAETDNLAIGTFNGNILTLTSGSVTKDITVNLEVINDATQFSVEKSYFAFTLLKADNLSASGTSNVNNPNALTITVDSYPAFLQTVSLTGNVMSFTSKLAQTLGTGLFSGNIVLKAGSVTKTVSVSINVVEHINHEFSGAPFYFAQDKKKVQINKTDVSAVKVYMKLEMFFSGYGETHQESQTYQLSYFQGKAIFYPGDEVNDFFVKQRNLQDFQQSFTAYQLANVKMTFTEMDADDNILNTFVLNNVKFAPGYTPYCFPFFTDFGVRRFYRESKFAVSADLLGQKPPVMKLLNEIGQTFNNSSAVRTFTFTETDISVYDFSKLKLVPVSAPEKHAVIFWETHNLVFDWLHVNGEFEIPSDFENTLSENVKNGKEEKFDSIQKDTFNINTGWILPEERQLIDELLKSRFVIIETEEKTVKAIPTGKKSTIKSSKKGFEEMILEFKILNDER